NLQSFLVDFCFGFSVLCCTYFTNLPLRSLVKGLLYAPHATFEQRIVIASLLQLCRCGAMLFTSNGHSPSDGLLRDRVWLCRISRICRYGGMRTLNAFTTAGGSFGAHLRTGSSAFASRTGFCATCFL